MPTPRTEIAVAELEGRVFVAGGFTDRGAISDALDAYDPESDTWEAKSTIPPPLHHAGMAQPAGRLYLTGGYSTGRFTPDTVGAWAYDPSAQRWSAIADLPAPRAAHAMAALEGRLYVIGGVGPTSEETWVYDPETDLWTSAAPMPTAREHLAAVVLGDRIYAIGGRDRGLANLDTVEAYDADLGMHGRRCRGCPRPVADSAPRWSAAAST